MGVHLHTYIHTLLSPPQWGFSRTIINSYGKNKVINFKCVTTNYSLIVLTKKFGVIKRLFKYTIKEKRGIYVPYLSSNSLHFNDCLKVLTVLQSLRKESREFI